MYDERTGRAAGVGVGSPILHMRCPADVDPALYRMLLGLVADVTPVVQAVPPSVLVADVSGSIRYFDRSPDDLARTIRARALALYGLPVAVGIGPTWSVAAMASRDAVRCGLVAVGSAPEEVAAFLHHRPIGDLYGIKRAQAQRLTAFGVHSIGLLAQLPEATVQRVLGGREGRRLREVARGIDRRAVVPTELPHSAGAQRRFPRDTLAPEAARAALLSLAVELGDRLRARKQAARALTMANRSQVHRSRQLPGGPSAHTEDLRDTAYEMYDALGLQRARVRGIGLRCEQLIDAAAAAEQLSFDQGRERRLRAEKAIDLLNARFGSGTVGPAASYRQAG
ncbi:DNA polymerase IV (plasmid) [Streptomyces sp. enrichment culture]|uniref:DNA polymerase Y family protein n=1 Tax=Streptomyces sp. enrichment culture TaxID=1795815 RepID=UPI003F55E5E3